jgi:hypothetical protein
MFYIVYIIDGTNLCFIYNNFVHKAVHPWISYYNYIGTYHLTEVVCNGQMGSN